MFHAFGDIMVSDPKLDKLRLYKNVCRDVLKLYHPLLFQANLGAYRVLVQILLFFKISMV